MANNNKLLFALVAIIALLAVGAFVQKSYDIFAILPAGQINSGPNCNFITNVDPLNGAYSSYAQGGAWIAIDYNNDGTKEKFGYSSSTTGSSRADGCGGNDNSKVLVNDFNSAGDDIYYYFISSQPDSPNRIYVCSADGTKAKYFRLDFGAASGAITTCTAPPTTCTPNWSCTAFSACASGSQSRTCTDSNSCNVNTNKPAVTQSCSVSSGGITFNQVIAKAQQWQSGSVTFQQLIDYASQWVAQ